jgi:hypothetical protein
LIVDFSENVAIGVAGVGGIVVSQLNSNFNNTYYINGSSITFLSKRIVISLGFALGDTNAYEVDLPTGVVVNYVGRVLGSYRWTFITSGKCNDWKLNC